MARLRGTPHQLSRDLFGTARPGLLLQPRGHSATCQTKVEQTLDLADFAALALRAEGGSGTAKPGAAGAAHAVDEIFGQRGQIVIDDVRNALDVQSAGGHVGGYENAVIAFLESAQGLVALRLRAVSREWQWLWSRH